MLLSRSLLTTPVPFPVSQQYNIMQVMKMLTREKHTKLLSHFICSLQQQLKSVLCIYSHTRCHMF